MGRILCSITADTCGWHDPLCGLTDAALIAARYGATRFQEQRNQRFVSGRDAMLVELGKYGLDERDLVANINFFSKVVGRRRRARCSSPRAMPRPASTSTCGSRWTRSLPCTPGRIRWPPARNTRRRPSGCRRVAALRRPRTIRAGFAARRTRAATSTPKGCIHLEGRSTRSCPRVNRGWVSCAAGQSLRIVDLEGNQAVDTLFYNAADTAEHYSAQNTIQAQGRIYLTTGTRAALEPRQRPAAHRGRHLRPP